MKKRKNDKITFLVMTTLFFFISVSITLWIFLDYLNTGRKLGFGVPIIGLFIIIFAIKLLKSKYESIKSGEPLKDERLRKIETKAAASAFYVGIYWLLALSIIIDMFKLKIPSSSVPSVGLVGMAIIFGLAYWYFNKRGE